MAESQPPHEDTIAGLKKENFTVVLEHWTSRIISLVSSLDESLLDSTYKLCEGQEFIRMVQENIDHIELILRFKAYENAGRPEVSGDDPPTSGIYSWLETKLNEIVEGRYWESIASDEETADTKRGRTFSEHEKGIEKLIQICAELWSIKLLKIHKKIADTSPLVAPDGGTLFEKLSWMASYQCTDMIKELTSCPITAERLKTLLEDKGNVQEISKLDMNKSTIEIIGKYSRSFYIIPNPLEDGTNSMKRYAIHFPIWKDDDVNGHQESGGSSLANCHPNCFATEERDKLIGVLADTGFTEISHKFTPNYTRFKDLIKFLKDSVSHHRIQKKCSILFISVFSHGVHRHIRDTQESYMQISDILKIINGNEELKAIPKIVVIQACQNDIPCSNVGKKTFGDGTEVNFTTDRPNSGQREDRPNSSRKKDRSSLQEIMESETVCNTFLMMAAEGGRIYIFDSIVGTFIGTLAETMKGGQPTTFEQIFVDTKAAMQDKFERQNILIKETSCSIKSSDSKPYTPVSSRRPVLPESDDSDLEIE